MTGRRVRRAPGYWDDPAGEPGRNGEPGLTGGLDLTGGLGLNSGQPGWSGPDGGDLSVDGVRAPSQTDPVARAASAIIGGPAGRRLASATGFWRALPVLVLLAAAMISLGVVQKDHCRAQGWSSPDQFWHECYSDIPVLFGSGSLGEASRPGLNASLGKDGLGLPPVTGAAMWVVSGFIPTGDEGPREFFDLSAVLMFLVLAGAVYACVLMSGRQRRPWDAAHLALSPVLVTAALISYQLLAVGLLVLAILAWTRARPVWAGVWFGFAVASAPVLSLLALAVLALGVHARRLQPAMAFIGTGLATWWLLRVFLLPGLFGGVRTAWHDWTGSVPGYGSLWLVPQLLNGAKPKGEPQSIVGRILLRLFGWLFHASPLTGSAASALSLLGLIVLLPPLVWFAFGGGFSETSFPRRRPAAAAAAMNGVRLLAPLGLAMLAAGLITVKSLPVQASLLLLPLMALTGVRWRDHLIWATTELVYFIGVWIYIGGDSNPNRGLPDAFYLVLLLARLAGITWIGVQGVLICRRRVLADEPPAQQPPADLWITDFAAGVPGE